MELRQLTHFLAVAEATHFTRAAARVHLTQSSLSSSIRALERELGSDLFVRSTRRVELTEAGRALLPAAERAVAAAEDGLTPWPESAGWCAGNWRSASSRPLRAGQRPGITRSLSPQASRRDVCGCTTPACRRSCATADGELELAIVDLPLGPQANRVDGPTDRHRIAAARRRRTRSARPPPPRTADRPRRPRVRRIPPRLLTARQHRPRCRAAGLQRRVVCEVDTIADLVELVALGLGVSLLPPAAIRMAGDRAIGLATDPSIPRDLMLVTPLDREPSPAGAAFLDLLDA